MGSREANLDIVGVVIIASKALFELANVKETVLSNLTTELPY